MGGEGLVRLSAARRGALVLQSWIGLLRIRLALRRRSLPDLVADIAASGRSRAAPVEPRRLGRLVYRALHVGPFRARCLTTCLVFLRMLHRQGVEADLVIGLPPEPTGPDAHSWVEVEGEVVGPPPGRMEHRELVRYGCDPAVRA